jgi:hypothetical protein
MADIFMSYSEKDRDAVSRLAAMLQTVGWSVWWDRRIPAGQTWRAVLEREMQSMRCMVVLWSFQSVQSEWVCEEAAEGHSLGRLVPVSIDRVRPPAGFREIQAADLVDWDGTHDFGGFQRLVEDIERLIGKPGAQPPQATVPVLRADAAVTRPEADAPPDRGLPALASTARRLAPWAATALVVFIAGGAYFGVSRREPVDARKALERGAVTPTLSAAPPALPVVAASAALPGEPGRPPAAAASKPVAAAVVTSSQAGKRADIRVPGGVKNAPVASSVSARCAALLERLEVGETLSSASQSFLRKECQP